ncbi:MAG TPA: signal peptidase I [Phenylobacterium sp.]|nr:signal peptidase I [Phenylobacterium sp.]
MTAGQLSGPRATGGRFGTEVVETVKTVVFALVIATALRVLVFQPYTIPSSSMEPGLVTGDYIVVSKWSYGWSRASLPFNPPWFPKAFLKGGRVFGHDPQRGDVIVFRLPRDPDETYIKRLIGLPGDRVQVIRGAVYVNGRPIPRQFEGQVRDHDDPARVVQQASETAPDGRRYETFAGSADGEGDNTDVYVVPEGTYFFMGDNRDNSADSRWPKELGVGFVPAENLVGKAQAVVLSWRDGASVLKPWTWLNLDVSRFLQRVR